MLVQKNGEFQLDQKRGIQLANENTPTKQLEQYHVNRPARPKLSSSTMPVLKNGEYQLNQKRSIQLVNETTPTKQLEQYRGNTPARPKLSSSTLPVQKNSEFELNQKRSIQLVNETTPTKQLEQYRGNTPARPKLSSPTMQVLKNGEYQLNLKRSHQLANENTPTKLLEQYRVYAPARPKLSSPTMPMQNNSEFQLNQKRNIQLANENPLVKEPIGYVDHRMSDKMGTDSKPISKSPQKVTIENSGRNQSKMPLHDSEYHEKMNSNHIKLLMLSILNRKVDDPNAEPLLDIPPSSHVSTRKVPQQMSHCPPNRVSNYSTSGLAKDSSPRSFSFEDENSEREIITREIDYVHQIPSFESQRMLCHPHYRSRGSSSFGFTNQTYDSKRDNDIEKMRLDVPQTFSTDSKFSKEEPTITSQRVEQEDKVDLQTAHSNYIYQKMYAEMTQNMGPTNENSHPSNGVILKMNPKWRNSLFRGANGYRN